MRRLPDSYWWLESHGVIYLRERWACVGVAYADGRFQMTGWPSHRFRQAASQHQACRFMQGIVLAALAGRPVRRCPRRADDREAFKAATLDWILRGADRGPPPAMLR